MKKLSIFFLFLPLASCIEEFDNNIEEGPKRLVVEGSITTEQGPYLVRLSQSEKFNFHFTKVDEGTVSGAVVTISDDENNSETLQEIKTGIYSTAQDGTGIRGVVGRKYQLSITLNGDGAFYQSIPQEILPVADLTSVSFEVETKGHTVLPFIGIVPPVNGINVVPEAVESGALIDNPGTFVSVPEELVGEPAFLVASIPMPVTGAGKVTLPGEITNNLINWNQVVKLGFIVDDVPGERNFYRWSGRVTFGVPSTPEAFTLRGVTGRTINYVNIPKTCCSQCYISFELPTVTVGNDRLIDGGQIQKEIGEIPINNFYFGQRLYAEVVQSSLSFEAYQFFSSIDKQSGQVGSIFDSSPELLISNMVNMDDPDDVVLGYFWASDVSVRGQFIPNPLPVDGYVLSDDCRVLTNNLMTSSIVAPDFWPN